MAKKQTQNEFLREIFPDLFPGDIRLSPERTSILRQMQDALSSLAAAGLDFQDEEALAAVTSVMKKQFDPTLDSLLEQDVRGAFEFLGEDSVFGTPVTGGGGLAPDIRTWTDPETGRRFFLEKDDFGKDKIGKEIKPVEDPGAAGAETEGQKQARESADARSVAANLQRAAELEEQIRSNAAAEAALAEQQQFNQVKFSVETAQGNRAAALAATTAIVAATNAQNDLIARQTEIKNSANQLVAQMNFQAQQSQNAQVFQAAQQAANRVIQLNELLEQSRSRNIDQQIEIARQVADFSRDPGDIVANIAAIEQFGSISTALANGFTGLSNEALDRGGQILNTQDQAVAEGERIATQQAGLQGRLDQALDPNLGVQPAPTFNFTPEIPEFEQIDFEGLFNQFAEQFGGITPEALTPEAPAAAQPVDSGFAGTALSPEQIAAANAENDAQIAAANTIVEPSGAVQTAPVFDSDRDQDDPQNPANAPFSFAEGGVGLFNQPATVKVAENGPEMLIGVPQPSGGSLLDRSGLFGGGVDKFGQPQLTPQLPDTTGVPRTNVTPQQIGSVTQPAPQPAATPQAAAPAGPQLTPLQERTRKLLSDAFQRAFAKFKLAAPDIPTFAGGIAPVGVSAPGTNPDLQQAAAGITAAGSGVKRSQFFNDLINSRATGVQQGVPRRTG